VIAWGANNFGQVNVPPTLSSVVAIAAGYDHSLAMRLNGALVAWGNNASGQTNTQAALTNFAAITAGGDHSLVIANRAPNAFGQSVYANVNRDRLTTLSGSDADGDVFTCRITSLPTTGALYQYATNGRGPPIQAPNTLVTDPNKRVYFAPPPDNFTDRPQFKFRMNDGLSDSSEASVGITIYPPPAPDITSIGPGAGNTFRITFTGDANTSHCVWISTNLATWHYFGQATQTGPGDFLFVDFFATNCPQRYYRVQAACMPPALEITGFSRQPDGGFEVVFGAAPGGTYQVLASTNFLIWETLGAAKENPAGIFRFLDTSAAQRPNRLYRLTKP
jgi:hypothetical protein